MTRVWIAVESSPLSTKEPISPARANRYKRRACSQRCVRFGKPSRGKETKVLGEIVGQILLTRKGNVGKIKASKVERRTRKHSSITTEQQGRTRIQVSGTPTRGRCNRRAVPHNATELKGKRRHHYAKSLLRRTSGPCSK